MNVNKDKGWRLYAAWNAGAGERCRYLREYLSGAAATIDIQEFAPYLCYIHYYYERDGQVYMERLGVVKHFGKAKYIADTRAGLVRRRLPYLIHG